MEVWKFNYLNNDSLYMVPKKNILRELIENLLIRLTYLSSYVKHPYIRAYYYISIARMINYIVWFFCLVFLIPQRYVLGIMGLFAVCNAYTMRVCLNLAVTQMVKDSGGGSAHYDPNACPDDSEIIANGTVSTKPVSNRCQI